MSNEAGANEEQLSSAIDEFLAEAHQRAYRQKLFFTEEQRDLWRSFHDVYRENGVEPEIARQAAADAALGFSAQDSEAMREAERQFLESSEELSAESELEVSGEAERSPEPDFDMDARLAQVNAVVAAMSRLEEKE